jgi:FixJ family two-component response regulator
MSAPKAIIRIVDDDPCCRTALTRLLRAAGFETRTYSSAAEFLAADSRDPGCVILDVQMPGLNGLELQKALAAVDEPLPVIFLTGHGDIPMSVQAVKAGAVDFLTKPVTRHALLPAVGNALVVDTAQRAVRTRQRELSALYDSLTAREREVLTHVIAGKLNKVIAADLGTSERTIKAHRANIMDKLRVDSVAELVRIAQELKSPRLPAVHSLH